MFHKKFSQLSIHSKTLPNFYKFNCRFLGQGASFQTQTNKVKLRGKFLKSRNEDMPTLLWFPEVMEPCENWEKWFTRPDNKILDYRNVWLLNPRNFGDSDHHSSFDLEEVANDIERFVEEKQLTYVTVGGHGYGAKVASAFASYYHNRTSGVMCLEGGPIDHSFHEAWEEVRNIIAKCNEIPSNASAGEVIRKIENITTHPKWRAILKQNVIEGKAGGQFQWKFNMEHLAQNVQKEHRCDLSSWSERFGLFTGRAFVLFAEHSRWIFLNSNTIPFYKFFLRLEGDFPSNNFNYVQTPNDDPLNHWIHEYPAEQNFTVMNRMSRFLQWNDGVHVLLTDRSELGWYGVPERESKSMNIPGLAEYVPEHLHHNYKFTDAYKKSKERRGKIAANPGQFAQGFSNQETW